MSTPNTVVLIHGLWMTPRSWERWVERYEARGLTVVNRGWPGIDGRTPEELRADTSAIDELGIEDVIEHYTRIIEALDAPPVIIGHSFGGAFTQLLLDRGLGAAGVAIDSAPVKGLLHLPLSTLRSSFPILKNPANRHRAVALTADEFHYAFASTLDEDASNAAYERYAIPGPGGILFQGALANFNPHAATKVDFHNDDRAPLLVIAGEGDHVSPVSINRETAKKQSRSAAITAYKQFPDRSHYIVGQPGWEEVADYAIDWALDPRPDAD